MTPLQIVFLIIALVTLGSAIMMVTARRLMHSALWLVLSLLGVAATFATLQAGFYAVVQVLVYVGAIAILIIFAVMLTRDLVSPLYQRLNRYWLAAAVASAGVFAGLLAVFGTWSGFWSQLSEVQANPDELAEFGLALTSPTAYAIPFEVASVLLLAALIGAVFVAVDRKGAAE